MILGFESYELDLSRVVLRHDGREVSVEPQVFDLLRYLIERRGEVVRKAELLDAVWGDRFVSESALTTRIKLARRAVGDDGTMQRIIRTVHGKGYEFIADVQVRDGPLAVDAIDDTTAPEGHDDLPAALDALIGRDELLDSLVQTQADHRLVTLVGTGGVGKTSIGLELARRVAHHSPDGAFVVELVTVADRDATLGAFATALDVNTRQETSIEEAIVDLLRSRSVLLLVDNCEHVIDQVATLVDRILRAAPAVSIIATSREPLAVTSERVWAIEPLAVPADDLVDPEQLAAVPSIALFLERARAADPGFVLTSVNASAVTEICRRLDGIPLAIELAAARASAIDVTEIARRLDERFRLLKGVRRGSDPRHQTLHDAISWSYDLLTDEEQRVFESLAVFAGQFDLDAAESICQGDDVLDLLTRLTRTSMLAVRRPQTGGTRYEMLETFREYGRGRLDDHESVTLFAAHASQFAALAQSVAVDLKSTREYDAVMRADASFPDLRAAQRFAREVHDVDLAYGVIGSLCEYAMRTLRYEVFAWAESASGIEGGSSHRLHPTVTGMRAYGAWVRGEFASAVALARSARESEVHLGIPATGLVERVLANVLYATGELEAGLIEGARLIEVAEAAGDASRVAHAYYMKSVASSSMGHLPEAHMLIDGARAAARASGSPTDLASAWVAEGFAASDDSSAMTAFDRADQLARSAGNKWMSAFARTEASGLLVHLGRLEEGCEGLADMVDVWYRAGEWAQQWHTLSRCLFALDRIGRPEVAAEVLGAIEAHTSLGGPPVMTTLRDLTFETRDALATRLGTERCALLRASGASMPVTSIVDRTRDALLGRT